VLTGSPFHVDDEDEAAAAQQAQKDKAPPLPALNVRNTLR
jgi:hypothetical protein